MRCDHDKKHITEHAADKIEQLQAQLQEANEFIEAVSAQCESAEKQLAEALKREPVGIIEPSDHQTIAALVDPAVPLRMAVAETAPRSIQSLPAGTKLYTSSQP